MNLTISRLVLVLAVLAAHTAARADEPPPDQEQLDAAKTAFDDAKTLYDAGKFPEAIERLKESYRLSRNVFLLYNIGHAYDQAGQKPKALAFYRKFLAGAPADAAMRGGVQKRADELDKEHVKPDLSSTYGQADFHPQVIESIPPGKPFDVTASVPKAFGFTATLFYRGNGEDTYIAQAMTGRGDELVGRIPADKITGTSVQYYLDIKDQGGTVVARSGRATSPNLVNIEADAAPHVGSRAVSEEDPLTAIAERDRPRPVKFATARWISTSVAVALIGGTVAMYLLAKNHSDKLLSDSMSCGVPPCRVFDQAYDQGIESKGVRYNTLYQVGVGASVAAIAVAGYFWYRAVNSQRGAAASWAIVPTIGDRFTGAAAVARF